MPCRRPSTTSSPPTRKSKVQQVETYFRTIRNELSQLAYSKEAVDAARAFRATFNELNRTDVPVDLQRKVDAWYGTAVPARPATPVGQGAGHQGVPSRSMPPPTYLQYHYIVTNPYPPSSASCSTMPETAAPTASSTRSIIRCCADAAGTFGFFDLMLADPAAGRIVYAVRKEVDFAASLRSGSLPAIECSPWPSRAAAPMPKSTPPAWKTSRPTRPRAARRSPSWPRRSSTRIPSSACWSRNCRSTKSTRSSTGGRRWRQDGFGATGEAYLVGADNLARSGPRAFYENRNLYYADLKSSGAADQEIDAIRRYGTPVLQQHIATEAVQSALGRDRGRRRDRRLSRRADAGLLGAAFDSRPQVGPDRQDRRIGGLRTDRQTLRREPDHRGRHRHAGGGSRDRPPGCRARCSGRCAELTAGVTRFAAGDYGAKVAVRSRDEIGRLCSAFNGMVDQLREKNIVIENKNRENEQLLLNMLPGPIANRLRGGEKNIADGFAEVTVAVRRHRRLHRHVLADAAGRRVVSLLNGLFSRFDDAAQELGIEKIKTVGDAYMAVCGLPDPGARPYRAHGAHGNPDGLHHPASMRCSIEVTMKLRVGVNSGPVVAGVIGKTKYIYDLWGDTVNLASRMESGGLPDMIQVTRPVYEKLKDRFVFEPRGTIEVKGKGLVEAWLLKL